MSSDPAGLQRHALRLAVLADEAERANAAYQEARDAAAGDFAAARNSGTTQHRLVLPDGSDAGLFSLWGGGQLVEVREDELLLHVALTDPSEIEDYVLPAALTDKRVLDLLSEVFPDLVARRVNAVHRARLQKELEKNDGYVTDPPSGEKVKVATVTPLRASGRFTYKPDDHAAGKIREALQAGVLTRDGEIILPAGETGGAE